MERVLSILIFLLCICFSSVCQTVIWQLPPSDYEEITRINTNLFKVAQNGKIGLITADGSIIAPVENDEITDYYENRAIVTKADAIGERVMGCLTDTGKYYSFKNKYYSIPTQRFFSDGLLTVFDDKGRVGYVDQSGNPVLGFNGKYDIIKPFTEGYASVYKNSKYYLIDRSGHPVRFKF